MALIRLAVNQFRNLSSIELEPLSTGFNIIHGANGSGKTSLLESIYFLSRGRSFRCSLTERIISNLANNFSIFVHFLDHNVQVMPVGLERHRDKTSKMRLNGKDLLSIAEVTRLIPVCLLNTQSYSLIDGGPAIRRKYLDWGLFYGRNDFLTLWQRFERILKQRNTALKNRLSRQEVDIWTQELIGVAILFDQARQEYVQQLQPILTAFLTELLEEQFDIKITYQCGWDKAATLESVWADSYLRDAWLGYTQFGPHKADLKLSINGVSAKDFLSRGQQKLFVCAMLLAQGRLLFTLTNKSPIFLVDDLPSELDDNSLRRVMGLLEQQKTQVFVTTIDSSSVNEFLSSAVKTFHVEHGRIKN